MENKLCVLIVEDHPALLDSLKLFVESFSEVQILSADSFLSAEIWIKKANRIDLLLADVNLPGPRTGVNVAEAAVGAHPNVAVVMFSADQRSDVDGLTDRYSFVSKPFGKDEVTRHIDSAFLRLRNTSKE
jgi:DNA-binding NarL/FixJ family response regulator